jgi:hypothetical protein
LEEIAALRKTGAIMFVLRATTLALILNWSHSAFAEVDYRRDIRPLLADRCYACHGPDAAQRKADLRLDRREVAVEAVIVPGDAMNSDLIDRITSNDPDVMMPPPDAAKKRLTKAEVELLRQWINGGAPFADHWSFVSPKRPVPPPVKDTRWTRNPIDRFVAAGHQRERVSPNAIADRPTLIRRLSLDIIGLPPSVDEVESFLNDRSADAYETVVDRLLASEHYGEHRARFWLDAARYADTNGYQYDLEREQWVWRDWVIQAFNSNMPFDQFTVEQLAGDLLPQATDHQRLATAFNRNHPITIEGGVIDEEYRTEYVIDRVVTTSTVWLGLTMGCARCHDHKYDPISQREFYEFFAYFNQVPERGLQGFNPKLKITSPLQSKRLTAAENTVAKLENRFERLMTEDGVILANWEQKAKAAEQQTWHSTTPNDVRSVGGATLIRQEDGSILASGKNPATDVYEYDWLSNGEELFAVRIEALTDPSFVGGGTGRASNANFVLSEFEIWAADDKNGPFKRLVLSQAVADYSQKGYPVDQAIDGKLGRQGWAVDGNSKRENREAYFVLAVPKKIPSAGRIRVRVVHQWGGSHQIGRFRISYANKPITSLPTRLVQLLAVPTNQRTNDQTMQLKMALAQTYGTARLRAAVAALTNSVTRLKTLTVVPETMVMSQRAQPRKTHILYRGQYDQPREEVEANTPEAFPRIRSNGKNDRLTLARWITSGDNPLTARVTVNRIWQQIFGIGIVETSEDFGTQGAFPSHPDLLDWLAVEFIESGWDVKSVLKQIVLSQTYRQSSAVTADQFARDPLNRLLARGPRARLDAEVIRDSAIAVSGLLQRDIGGPSVFPYHPAGLWQEINNRPGYSRVYKQDTGGKLYRRSLYTFWKRTVPPPSLAAFDAPEREYCVVRRSRTNTPLQAFVLLNDPQFVEAARHLGERMLHHANTDLERIEYGFQSALARRPKESEIRILLLALAERRVQYQKDEQQANDVLSVGESTVAQGDIGERAAWATIGRILLNLSEFITKG